MKEFTDRFPSLGDMAYGILAEIGLTLVMMVIAFILGWLVVGWLA